MHASQACSSESCSGKKIPRGQPHAGSNPAPGRSLRRQGRRYLRLRVSGRPVKGPATLVKAWMLESFVYPRLGSSAGQCDHCRGTHETAHQTKQRCSQIFRDALATGRAVRDITVDLRGALAPVVSESHAAITNPAKIGALLRAIDVYDRHPTTAIALKLAPLVFVRPGELRGAEWSELDLDAAEWLIPAERMNMGERHIVPLASQAVELLRVQREAHG